ncbi:DUF6438 domain-containing protein [Halobacillus sp. Marseille-Q1614]|uniref:DUF6438 domain-containing protein n=1 Tax=Halobacillus sp. Marseille-Q1614 TaxID=2709134 RepID=UPI0015700C87|nr:DUF6438 domain-containing protein [Halobacillus sp. Marseille-Q1614]
MFKTITLERTPCEGESPVYKISISSEGEVDWEGQQFVQKEGHHTWSLTDEQVEQLQELIEDFNYMSYQYIQGDRHSAADHPYCMTSVQDEKGCYREINHYLGDTLQIGRDLETFEEKVEEIAGTHAYIGTLNPS